ncbi:MAG: CYTH domain-containing protein, partial [Candidatus Zixiibacteriota bacterium]
MNHERSSESELKFALDGKAEFEVLMKALPQPARRLRQENYFFDTPGSELRRSGWALRLRLETDASGVERAELTAKGAAMRVGALSRRPEINAEL